MGSWSKVDPPTRVAQKAGKRYMDKAWWNTLANCDVTSQLGMKQRAVCLLTSTGVPGAMLRARSASS